MQVLWFWCPPVRLEHRQQSPFLLQNPKSQPRTTNTQVHRNLSALYMYCTHIHICTENYSNGRSSPTGFPIEEEAQENIYDQPHTSTECSSPPRGLEYYNYRAIWNQQSQYGAEASAMVLVPPSPARTASTRPTPPPKPKKPSKDYKHTGTQRSVGIVSYYYLHVCNTHTHTHLLQKTANDNLRSSNSDFQMLH